MGVDGVVVGGGGGWRESVDGGGLALIDDDVQCGDVWVMCPLVEERTQHAADAGEMWREKAGIDTENERRRFRSVHGDTTH